MEVPEDPQATGVWRGPRKGPAYEAFLYSEAVLRQWLAIQNGALLRFWRQYLGWLHACRENKTARRPGDPR